MVDGRQDMEGWGVYSVFKEAGRLLYRHVRILRPFILAFLFPLALILFLEVIGIAWVLASVAWLTELVQPDHLGGILGHYRRRHSGFHAFHVGFLKDQNSFFQPNSYYFIVNLILHTHTFTFLILFITWLFLSLFMTAIAKTIYYIYFQNSFFSLSTSTYMKDYSSSQVLILIHSIFTTLPHFIYHMFILFLCFLVVDIFTYFILVLPFYLFLDPQLFPYAFKTVHIWFSYFLFLILDSWFDVSLQVAMLEVY